MPLDIISSQLGAVHGLEWVTAKPFLLAVLMAPATLVVWDTQGVCCCLLQSFFIHKDPNARTNTHTNTHTGGILLWHRDLSSGCPVPFASMCQEPLDRQQLCLCGAVSSSTHHHLAVVTLTDVAKDDVSVRHLKLAVKAGECGCVHMSVCVCVLTGSSCVCVKAGAWCQ